jgi:predicted P-loop ATPase
MTKNNNTADGEGGAHRRIDVDALLSRVDIVKLIDSYIPLTKSGAEYEACCPFHTESTPSFKVSETKQIYHCFGCGANGSAISFLVEYRGLSFLDACRELGADVPGASSPGEKQEAVQRESVKQKKPDPVWTPLQVAPPDAPEPPKAHVKRGVPEMTWCYRAAAGAVIGYVYRFRTSDGGKDTIPLSWARREDTGVEAWHWISFAKPRPLYGLDRLAARPEATVLLVEGEKCADAAQAQLPDLVVVSWPGGCNAEGKVNWTPLAGRKVMTWADCDAKRAPLTKAERDALPDKQARATAQAEKPLLPEAQQPGTKAMRGIHGHLHALNARVWSIAIPPPGEKPNGWDIADAIAEGLVGEALVAHIRTQAARVAAPGAIDAIVGAPETFSTPCGAGAGQGPPPDDDGYDGDHGPQGWRRLLVRRDGKLVDCRENVYYMLKHHPDWQGVLWADEFAKRIVVRKPPPWALPASFVPGSEWDPNDSLRLGLWLTQRERLLIRNEQNLSRAAAWVASESKCHPVREYLDSLVWDGTERTKKWLTDYMGVKATEYTELAGHFFLIGMVARIFKPGCQMRFMVIFEGAQYRGKSSALRVLGGKWYSDSLLDLHNKDVYQIIQGIWLHEIGELDSFSRADATRVKAFVSSQTDRFRAPYDTVPRDWERQVVFGGSTNQDEYFKDPTGNTRFWPLRAEEVESINIDGLAGARDQLFAEAVALFKAGERWHPTSDEQRRLFEPEQSAREIVDPWQSIIHRYLDGTTVSRVTAAELLIDCLKIEIGKIDRAKQQSMSVAAIMKRLGWKKQRDGAGDREYYYERPKDAGAQPGSPQAEGGGDVPF